MYLEEIGHNLFYTQFFFLDLPKNELIFDDITLEPGTLMTVFHCPVESCSKKNYLDAKSVRTHCRRFHSITEYQGTLLIFISKL